MTHDQLTIGLDGPAAHDGRAAYRYQEQARRLGWTHAHAAAMSWASSGDLRHDERGFYRTSRTSPGRGRAVARARIHALIQAALLIQDGTVVRPTADGQQALKAWRAADIDAATDELDELPPLYSGQEHRRRYDQWQANLARHEAEAYAALERAIAQAEANHQAELERRREHDVAPRRYTSVWDAIHAPDDPGTPETNLGNVHTFVGADLIAAMEEPDETDELIEAHIEPSIAAGVGEAIETVARAPQLPAPTARRTLDARPAQRPTAAANRGRLTRPQPAQRRRRTLTAAPPGGGNARTLVGAIPRNRPHQPPRALTGPTKRRPRADRRTSSSVTTLPGAHHHERPADRSGSTP
ncbi:hypothetical protein [Nonomuraea typhae]|uniref:hypothetical protein n=1 Tax=Nonomuraea typhae TaxID=2603600 RepID=UPI0012F98CD2|nr:hypothetical protein [Nonomuraea typhae]